jgi:hypothetical protein
MAKSVFKIVNGGGTAGAFYDEPNPLPTLNVQGKAKVGLGVGVKSVFNPDFIKQQEDTLSKYESDYEALDKTIEDDYKKYVETEKQLEQLQIDLQEAPKEMIWNKTQKFNQVRDLHNSLVDKIKTNTTEQKKIFDLYTTQRGNYEKVGLPTGQMSTTDIGEQLKAGTFQTTIPETIGDWYEKQKPKKPSDLKSEFEKGLDPWAVQKKDNPELQKVEDYAFKILSIGDDDKEIATIYQNLTSVYNDPFYKLNNGVPLPWPEGVPIDVTLRDLKETRKEPLSKRIAKSKYDEAINIHNQMKDIANKVSNPGLDFLSSIGWKGMLLLTGAQVVNTLLNSPAKIKDKFIPEKEMKQSFIRIMKSIDPETGNISSSLSENDLIIAKYLRNGALQGKTPEMIKVMEQQGGFKIPQQVNIFGGKLYAGLPADEIVKSIVAVGKVTNDMVKGLDPVKISQVTQQLLNTSPALASAFLKAVEKPEEILKAEVKEPVKTKEELYSEKYGIPLEKVKVTEVPKVEPKEPVIPKEFEELAEETRKYKTVEEWMSAIYHSELKTIPKAPVPYNQMGNVVELTKSAGFKSIEDFYNQINKVEVKAPVTPNIPKAEEPEKVEPVIEPTPKTTIPKELAGLAEVSAKLLSKQGESYTPEGTAYITRDGKNIAQSSAGQHTLLAESVGFKGKNPIASYLKATGDIRVIAKPNEINVSFYKPLTTEQINAVKDISVNKELIFDSYVTGKVISGNGFTDFYTQATAGLKAEGKAEATIPVTEKTVGVEPEKVTIEPEEVTEKVTEEEGINKKYQEAKAELIQLKESIKLSKAKGKEIAEVKKELDIYIRKMPPPIRGRMFTDYMNIKTQEDLDNAIIKMNKLIENHFSKEYVLMIEDELKAKYIAPIKNASHILAGKYTPEVQRLLNTIKVGINKPRNIALQQIKENIKLFNSGEKISIAAENALLNMQGIKEMSLDELRRTLEQIKDVKLTGKIIRAEQENQRKSDLEKVITKVLKTVTGKEIELDENGNAKIGTAYKTLPKTKWERGAINKVKKAIDGIVNWQLGGDSLMDKLSALDKISKPYQSDLSKLWNKDISEPQSNEIIGLSEDIEKLQKGFQDAYDITKKGDILKKVSENKKEIDLGTFKNSEGDKVELKLNREQIIKKYMQLDDPTLEKTFDEGMLYTDKMKDAIRNNITPEDLKYIDTIKEIYQNVWKKVNPIYGERYGVDFPYNPNYSGRILREVDDSNTSESDLLIDNLMEYASILNPSLKLRTKSNQTLKYDEATPALLKYVSQMEHFIAFAKPLQEINGVFKDNRVKSTIKLNYGNNIYNKIMGFVKDITNDSIDKNKTINFLDKIRYNFTRSILAKTLIGAKQGLSVLTYMTEMPIGDFFKGVANFWKHPLRNSKFLIKNSSKLKDEIGTGFERDIHDAMKRGYNQVLANSNKLSDYLFTLHRFSDKLARLTGMWAKFYSVTKGKCILDTKDNINNALREAEKSTDRTQASYALETKAEPQRGGSFMKLMTMFTDEVNKYFRITADNARNFKYGRGSKIKAASNIALAWAILPAIFTLITTAGRFKKKDLWKLAFGPLTSMLVFGQLMESMVGWLAGETYDYLASPVLSTVREIQYTLMKISKWADPLKEMTTDDFVKMVEHFATAAGQLTGLPTPYAIQVKGAIEKGRPEELLWSEYTLGKEKKKTGAPIGRIDIRKELGIGGKIDIRKELGTGGRIDIKKELGL